MKKVKKHTLVFTGGTAGGVQAEPQEKSTKTKRRVETQNPFCISFSFSLFFFLFLFFCQWQKYATNRENKRGGGGSLKKQKKEEDEILKKRKQTVKSHSKKIYMFCIWFIIFILSIFFSRKTPPNVLLFSFSPLLFHLPVVSVFFGEKEKREREGEGKGERERP